MSKHYRCDRCKKDIKGTAIEINIIERATFMTAFNATSTSSSQRTFDLCFDCSNDIKSEITNPTRLTTS